MLQEARKFLVIARNPFTLLRIYFVTKQSRNYVIARLTKSVVAISSVISVDCFAIGPYDLAKSFLGNETIEETS